jgi:hypothetical protein
LTRALLTAAGIAGFALLLWWATAAHSAVECEACMEFAGRRACRSVRAGSREEAEQAAVQNACALLAGGVTQTLACQGSAPASLTCTE